MNTEAQLARDAIREEYTRVEGRIAPSVYGSVLQEGKLAGLAFALGALGAPDPTAAVVPVHMTAPGEDDDPFEGLTGADAVGADPSAAFVANRGGR